MDPYQIYEAEVGKYDPDKPPKMLYSVWYLVRREEYLQEHPEAVKNQIEGHFFEAEQARFYLWLNKRHQRTK